MRHYELMVILDPSLDERTVAPSLDTLLTSSDRGRQRRQGRRLGPAPLAYEIAKQAEGIYAIVNLTATPATVSELDRQLGLNETVLRTKVLRNDK